MSLLEISFIVASSLWILFAVITYEIEIGGVGIIGTIIIGILMLGYSADNTESYPASSEKVKVLNVEETDSNIRFDYLHDEEAGSVTFDDIKSLKKYKEGAELYYTTYEGTVNFGPDKNYTKLELK